MPFSRDDSPIECIATSKFTHVMKQVEPNLWLNMVVQHPEALYGKGESEAQTASDQDGETIANAKFTYSQFTEQDSRIFYLLLEQYYAYLKMFHGTLKDLVAEHTTADSLGLMGEQLSDFTMSFQKYFFTEEYCDNFFWNVCFQGFFYCPIDKRSFL